MKKCKLSIFCRDCPSYDKCPRAVRRDKQARRPMAYSASKDLMCRAAKILAKGWYTCEGLGRELYGVSPTDKTGRMSISVRARRPINKMKRLGVLATRPTEAGVAEYTLLPEGAEVFGC